MVFMPVHAEYVYNFTTNSSSYSAGKQNMLQQLFMPAKEVPVMPFKQKNTSG